MTERLGLYLHIPFCQKKCHYCDFLTFANMDDKMDEYVDYLCKEIALYQGHPAQIDSLYFGGGTPSYLSSQQMAQIMAAVYRHFNLSDDCEISIEMNPESITAGKLTTYLEYGFNRFSMGVQSFDDQVLKLMGRLHNRQTVFDKVDLMQSMGIDRLGIDMMFGNPKQTMTVLQEDVRLAMTLPIHHISYYSLMIKERTPFQRWVLTGQIKLIEDEEERSMYHYIQDQLAQYGFHQYEISNFAKPGYESRHNKKYWQLENYLGLGLGASSNIDLDRFVNHRRFADYYQMIDAGQAPVQYREEMTMEEREKEFIMLNLRLLKGFKLEEINQRFGIDFLSKYQTVLDKHLQTGIINYDADRVWFTDFGLDVGNQFYLDIL